MAKDGCKLFNTVPTAEDLINTETNLKQFIGEPSYWMFLTGYVQCLHDSGMLTEDEYDEYLAEVLSKQMDSTMSWLKDICANQTEDSVEYYDDEYSKEEYMKDVCEAFNVRVTELFEGEGIEYWIPGISENHPDWVEGYTQTDGPNGVILYVDVEDRDSSYALKFGQGLVKYNDMYTIVDYDELLAGAIVFDDPHLEELDEFFPPDNPINN